MTSYVALIVVILSCFSWTGHGFFPNNNKGITCVDLEIKNGNHKPRAWFTWRHGLFTDITFFCYDGFKLEGEAVARCTLTGEWSQIPKCIPTETGVAARMHCDLPPMGDNVDVTPLKRSYNPGDSVSFACPGYRKMDGHGDCSCGEDGEFHPAPPACIAPRCIPPKVPKNGGIVPNDPSYAVGDVVYYKCATGFQLVGQGNTTCGEDGYFPYTAVRCKAVTTKARTCSKPVPRSKQYIYEEKESYDAGENVTFLCADGRRLRGNRVLNCLPTGEWSANQPTCEKVCKLPASPDHGRFVNKKNFYSVGQRARFVCDEGYQATTSPVCGSSGKFKPRLPKCDRVRAWYYH